MIYLKPFNESNKYSSANFRNFFLWVPECFKTIDILLDLKNKSMFIDPNLNKLIELAHPKDPESFIKKCENMHSRISEINMIIKSPPKISKQSKTPIELYNELSNLKRDNETLKSFYSDMLKIKKIDITVFSDIRGIIEEIYDDNNCDCQFVNIRWEYEGGLTWDRNRTDLNDLKFEFTLINSKNGGYFNSNKDIKPIYDHIIRSNSRLKAISCKSERAFQNGVIHIDIRLSA